MLFCKFVTNACSSWAVVASDGAANTMRHLGLDKWTTLSRADDAELHSLLERCRQWEAEADPDGRDLPRSKRHDDKTAVVVELSPR